MRSLQNRGLESRTAGAAVLLTLASAASLGVFYAPITLPPEGLEGGGERRHCGSLASPAPERARSEEELHRCLAQLESGERLIGAFGGYAALTLVLMGAGARAERRSTVRQR